MKALKSDLAKSLLANEVSAKALQGWLVHRLPSEISITHRVDDVVTVTKVVPIIVPKAD
jgi:hypothetical protein